MPPSSGYGEASGVNSGLYSSQAIPAMNQTGFELEEQPTELDTNEPKYLRQSIREQMEPPYLPNPDRVAPSLKSSLEEPSLKEKPKKIKSPFLTKREGAAETRDKEVEGTAETKEDLQIQEEGRDQANESEELEAEKEPEQQEHTTHDGQ